MAFCYFTILSLEKDVNDRFNGDMKNKRMQSFAGVLVLGLVLGGCILTGGQNAATDVAEINQTRQGVLSQGTGSGLYVLQVSPGVVVELHDGNASLAQYMGQSVKVTGQFSGTTLYVDQVEALGQ